jgi:hypothetical protein
MAVLFTTNDVAIIQPGNTIFAEAFSKKKHHVNLPLCLKKIIQHGTSNRTCDGVVSSGEVEFDSRIDFGCARSGSTKILPGVWRPDLLCGINVFEKVSEDK